MSKKNKGRIPPVKPAETKKEEMKEMQTDVLESLSEALSENVAGDIVNKESEEIAVVEELDLSTPKDNVILPSDTPEIAGEKLAVKGISILQDKIATMDPQDFINLIKSGEGFESIVGEAVINTLSKEEMATLQQLSTNVVVEAIPDPFDKRDNVALTIDKYIQELKALGMVDKDAAVATKYYRIFTSKKEKKCIDELAVILKADVTNLHDLINRSSITVYNSDAAASIRYYRGMKNGSIKYKGVKGEVA